MVDVWAGENRANRALENGKIHLSSKLTGTLLRPFSGAFNHLLPQRCPLCRQFCLETGLCAECWKGLVFISSPACNCCGRPLPHATPDNLCGACLETPPPVAKIRACFVYNDVSRQLILNFKHGDGLHLTPLLARVLATDFRQILGPDHLVIPAPLHPRRYLKRRYNQSAELARALCTKVQKAAGHKIFAAEVLTRQKPSPSQARLSKSMRRLNVAGAFHVPLDQRDRLRNRPILLIDDVMTTGATLYEASRTLIKAGSGPTSCLVVARVL